MKILTIFLMFFLTGCNLFYDNIETIEPIIINENHNYKIDLIIRLFEMNQSDTININKCITTKSIDKYGMIKKIKFADGNKILFNHFNNRNEESYPIFEKKGTSNSIIFVKGRGLWGNIFGVILIDKNTQRIKKIEFDHQAETPNVGANFTDSIFESRFENLKITFDSTLSFNSNNYSFNRALQKIDCISGATITCDAAINMIAKEIIKYKLYLIEDN